MIQRKIKSNMVGLMITMTVMACSSEHDQTENIEGESPLIEINTQELQEEAAHLIVNNCYSCHSPDATIESRLAPPMSQVKSHYLDEYDSKQEFVEAMIHFSMLPNKEDAIMFGAEKKFGLMPNMQYPKETAQLIANYLYDYEIETDDWLQKYYYTEAEIPVFEQGDYLGLGRYIATKTKQELGKNLKGKIKNEGTVAAVEFCQLKAIPIIDSMSREFDAQIYRVSDKNRNPNNLANSQESNYIKTYQKQLDAGEEMPPIVLEKSALTTFYMPIVTNDMCLQCHGVEKEMDADVLSKIQELYPKDKARGYDINQIRGIWKIEMAK